MSASARDWAVFGEPGTLDPGSAAHAGADSRALFELVYRQMRTLAASRGRELDDLVQTALVKVLKGLPSFEGRSELSTWTYRICYVTLVSHQRSAQRWLARMLSTPEVPDGPAPGLDPAESLERRERAERLRRALSRVSPKRRAVVVLHDFEELDIDQIAAIVGAKRNTVKSRLRDGHRQLARLLRDDVYFGDAAIGGDE